MNNVIEAMVAWRNHKITRHQFLRQLLSYEHWLQPRAGTETPTGEVQRFVFSSAEAMEEFDPLYSSSATQIQTGWELFSGDLRGIKQVVIDQGSHHELVISAQELPEWLAAAAQVVQARTNPGQTSADRRALVVPCAQLDMDAPLRWLRLGWQDFSHTKALSLLFGGVIAVISVLVSLFAYSLGRFALLAALLSGFVFIAPLIAVGLYCVSRQRGIGKEPHLRDSFALAKRVVGQAGVFALLQLVVLLVWSRAAMMVSAFVPMEPGNVVQLLEFLAIGSLVGSVFALLTFASMAFSLPMIADRDVDMVTACLSSIHAVLKNKLVLMYWAGIISALTAIGFATFFLGLVVIMPWLAYAAWHAYCETLDASDWPKL